MAAFDPLRTFGGGALHPLRTLAIWRMLPSRMKHSIRAQVRDDIKAARKIWLPWRVLLPFGIFSLVVIVICDHFGRLNMSLPLLNCVAVFGLLIYLKWSLRRQLVFWSTIAVLAALHAVLLWSIPWTSKWVPSVAIAGISSVDFCLMLWVLAAVEAVTESQVASK